MVETNTQNSLLLQALPGGNMWSCGYITCTWYLRVTKALMLEDAFVGVLFVCFGKGGVQRAVGGGGVVTENHPADN